MNSFTIVLIALAAWLTLGVLFVSLCMAASRADREMEHVLGTMNQARTLRQHVFAVRARSLRSMRRLTGARTRTVRTAAARERVADHAFGSRSFSTRLLHTA